MAEDLIHALNSYPLIEVGVSISFVFWGKNRIIPLRKASQKDYLNMNRSLYRTILYAVGALPFWTGKRKLIRLLSGDPGSYWDRETPLKPVYLEQPFFGGLEDESSSIIRQSLQELFRSHHLVHEELDSDKPYRVVKFSEKGVKKYYNLLVMNQDLDPPYWWIHHLNRLRNAPNSPVATGGELLVYNDEPYLTQAPAYRSDTERLQSNQTISIASTEILEADSGHFAVREAPVQVDQTPRLALRDETEHERVLASDLGSHLNHFGTGVSQVNPPDPYTIKGELVEATEPDADGLRNLTLRNTEDQKLTIRIRTRQIPDELPLEEGQSYVVGPLSEDETESEGTFRLIVQNDGHIRRYRP